LGSGGSMVARQWGKAALAVGASCALLLVGFITGSCATSFQAFASVGAPLPSQVKAKSDEPASYKFYNARKQLRQQNFERDLTQITHDAHYDYRSLVDQIETAHLQDKIFDLSPEVRARADETIRLIDKLQDRYEAAFKRMEVELQEIEDETRKSIQADMPAEHVYDEILRSIQADMPAEHVDDEILKEVNERNAHPGHDALGVFTSTDE